MGNTNAEPSKGQTRKPPVWEWEGKYECPDCGEGIDFFREEGYREVAAILESNNWVAQVFHSHNNPDWPEGRWQIAFYQKYKGRQRPPITKAAEQQHKDAYNRKKTQAQIDKAGA